MEYVEIKHLWKLKLVVLCVLSGKPLFAKPFVNTIEYSDT